MGNWFSFVLYINDFSLERFSSSIQKVISTLNGFKIQGFFFFFSKCVSTWGLMKRKYTQSGFKIKFLKFTDHVSTRLNYRLNLTSFEHAAKLSSEPKLKLSVPQKWQFSSGKEAGRSFAFIYENPDTSLSQRKNDRISAL